MSDTLLTLNMAAITAKDSFDENKENIVAVEKDNFALKAYLSYNYPQWKVVEYETSDAAVKAMQKGETDCIVSNSGTVSDYLKNNKLHSVFLTKEADVSFAVQQGEPVLLSGKHYEAYYFSNSLKQYLNCLQYNLPPLSALLSLLHLMSHIPQPSIVDNCMKDMLSMQNYLFQRQLYSLYFHQKNPLP